MVVFNKKYGKPVARMQIQPQPHPPAHRRQRLRQNYCPWGRGPGLKCFWDSQEVKVKAKVKIMIKVKVETPFGRMIEVEVETPFGRMIEVEVKVRDSFA